MARALFQSWFVDFDPVRAKLDGRHPDGLDEAIAARFPEHFDETDLGHTPHGWETRSLDKIAHCLNSLALQNYPPGNGHTLPVIKIAQLHMSSLSMTDRQYIEKLFDMSLGYVLNFSGRSFGEFMSESVGVDIHAEHYPAEGISKAKKLRTF